MEAGGGVSTAPGIPNTPTHYSAVTFSRPEMFLNKDTGSITRRIQLALMKAGLTSTEGRLV